MIKLSIIIPIYNAELYIRRCIESILTSHRSDFELMLINDGSIDSSESICKEYTNDSRVRYFKQENKGVAVARNRGIQEIRGSHFTIVDADDYVNSRYVDTIISDIDCENDLIIYDHYSGRSSCFSLVRSGLESGQSSNLRVLYQAVFEYRLNAQWDKVFTTSIVKKNNIFFPEGIKAGEDSMFFLQYLRYVNTYFVSNDALYYYVKNSGSAMANPKLEYISNLDSVFKAYLTFGKEKSIDEATYYNLYKALLNSLTKKVVSYKKMGISNFVIERELKKTLIYTELTNVKYHELKSLIKCFLMKCRLFDIIGKIISDK